MKISSRLCLVCLCWALASCRQSNDKTFWIYTSLYKDTIADLEPQLKKQFPQVEFRFYQAGSEEIAARVNTEIMAGGAQAHLLISSDRFWYEELAREGRLAPLRNESIQNVIEVYRHPQGIYSSVSLPMMVLVVNEKLISKQELPTSFADLLDERFRNKVTTGSPLASGTNFTSLVFLEKKWGKDFFRRLQRNGTLSEGGNSAVLRRVLSGERPIGLVLLENVLRFQDEEMGLKVVIPQEGAIVQNNVLAILSKPNAFQDDLAQKVAAWFFSSDGQEAMLRSYMHSPVLGFKAPRGAPSLADLQRGDFVWNQALVEEIVQGREALKENFAEALFNP